MCEDEVSCLISCCKLSALLEISCHYRTHQAWLANWKEFEIFGLINPPRSKLQESEPLKVRRKPQKPDRTLLNFRFLKSANF